MAALSALRHINADGLDLIKSFEGCKLAAYRDIKGIITIGYGHTGADVYDGMTINQAAADMFLRTDLKRTEDGVNACLNVSVNDNQFSALVCLAYNIGLGSFSSSTLLKCLNANMNDKAVREFERWDHANGVEIPGLLRRRQAERDLFMKA